ncbi:MAG: antitoxin family protein [Acidobacteriota bacterium]|nr:antitoxin family protein [Acidobacteriota bacterium]
MTTTVGAIYEQGVLRLKEPISLAEGTEVEVILIFHQPTAEEANPAEVLAAIASLPLEAPDGKFSGRDDDSVLYDKEGEE